MKIDHSRKLIILSGSDVWLTSRINDFANKFLDNLVLLISDKFIQKQFQQLKSSQINNLLGQEFPIVIADFTQGFNLEKLAIMIGIIKRAGYLILLLNDWQNLADKPDQDSVRWNNLNQATNTPNFYAYFQQLVNQYKFTIIDPENFNPALLPTKTNLLSELSVDNQELIQATTDQIKICKQILLEQQDVYFITAPRGRGKSTLAGMLSNDLLKNNQVIVTAPNKNAVKIMQKYANDELVFKAPDLLIELINSNQATNLKQSWLIIDEAARIPLPMLQTLINYFRKVVVITTIHGYEGTGRGFLLKLLQNITRTYQYFQLTKPLRWDNDDKLELFQNQLLLLDVEDHLTLVDYRTNAILNYQKIEQAQLVNSNLFKQFYALLMLSHYKTSPVDLRRIFDANKQHFWLALHQHDLIGGIIAIEEGNIQDEELINQIMLGTRRPRGNLVPQLLAYNYQDKQICRLKGLRISRIAIQPNWQDNNIGSQLLTEIIHYAKEQNYDYVSVSFGYTEQLANFWQKNDFKLVHKGKHLEASSGSYNGVMIRNISNNYFY